MFGIWWTDTTPQTLILLSCYTLSQSGSLYNDWGWFLSEKRITEINDFLRQKAGCAQEVPVFECLKDKTLDEIEGYRSEYEATAGILTQWHPVPDNDFFAADVIYENYTFPTRYTILTVTKMPKHQQSVIVIFVFGGYTKSLFSSLLIILTIWYTDTTLHWPLSLDSWVAFFMFFQCRPDVWI